MGDWLHTWALMAWAFALPILNRVVAHHQHRRERARIDRWIEENGADRWPS